MLIIRSLRKWQDNVQFQELRPNAGNECHLNLNLTLAFVLSENVNSFADTESTSHAELISVFSC